MAILFTAKEKSLDRYAAFDYGAFDVVEKNIRGAAAVREINIKARAALRYRGWSQRVNFLRRYFDPKVFEAIERDPSVLFGKAANDHDLLLGHPGILPSLRNSQGPSDADRGLPKGILRDCGKDDLRAERPLR